MLATTSLNKPGSQYFVHIALQPEVIHLSMSQGSSQCRIRNCNQAKAHCNAELEKTFSSPGVVTHLDHLKNIELPVAMQHV